MRLAQDISLFRNAVLYIFRYKGVITSLYTELKITS